MWQTSECLPFQVRSARSQFRRVGYVSLRGMHCHDRHDVSLSARRAADRQAQGALASPGKWCLRIRSPPSLIDWINVSPLTCCMAGNMFDLRCTNSICFPAPTWCTRCCWVCLCSSSPYQAARCYLGPWIVAVPTRLRRLRGGVPVLAQTMSTDMGRKRMWMITILLRWHTPLDHDQHRALCLPWSI